MRLKAMLGAAAAGVLLCAAGASASANAASIPASVTPQANAHAVGVPRTVTLLTGDRVTVRQDAPDRPTIQAGTGRQGTHFVVRTVRGHLDVIPVDALTLLGAGRLDPRLFDVTTLLGFGYDDRRADLPLIVSYTGGAPRRLAATRDLPAIGGAAVSEPRSGAVAFWHDITGGTASGAPVTALSAGIATVWLDGKRRPTDDVSNAQIGAPQAWAAGYTGTGVNVAVVDTGIDATHPDLAGKVLAEQNFSGDGDALDHVGHGTHVASTIAGSGAASGGRYKGVAPGAGLYDAKVCTPDGCTESAMLAGMQWAAADEHAKVVNVSIGGPDSPGTDPVEQAVETLTARYGTLFVVSAGNDGADGTVESPATADAALAVGAVDRTDALAEFSSRGPRVGDDAIKPDITAPGVDIIGARSKDADIGNPGDQYVTESGTSMAAPHVSGSAAILAQQHPTWSGPQLKAALMASAKPSPAVSVYGQGAGRVDVGRAVNQAVLSTPVSLSLGFVPFPHDHDATLTRTVSYHNAGTKPVTLTLAMHTTDAAGTPTPAGMFAVNPNRVTVPAGGDANVTVSVNTRIGPTGPIGGQLTGSDGTTVVQTPIAVVREAEAYNVTLTQIDRTGAPASVYYTLLLNPANGASYEVADPSGTGVARVPPGRYLLASTITTGEDPHRQVSLLARPVLVVSKATSVTIDARVAKPISVTVPRSGATSFVAEVGLVQKEADGTQFVDSVFGEDFTGVSTAQLGPTTPVPGFTGTLSSQWGKAGPDGSGDNSPYAYLLGWFDQGGLFTGLHRDLTAKDLATVHVDLAKEASGVTGTMTVEGGLPGGMIGAGQAYQFRYDLPGSRTEYLNNDSGILWISVFTQDVPSPDPDDPTPLPVTYLQSTPTAYTPGHTYHETWNQGVFGPALPPRTFPDAWVTRAGDTLTIFLPLLGDGAGREGDGLMDSVHSTLSRDGHVLGSQDEVFTQYPMPADPGRYQLRLDYARTQPATLTTRTSLTWTFRSTHVSGTAPVPLPVSVLAFTPTLDLTNRATNPNVLPIRVVPQPDSTAGTVRTLTVQVSYDDGTHWFNATVTRTGNGGVARWPAPSGHGYVSLRATSTDSKGNAVDETLIRAYRY